MAGLTPVKILLIDRWPASGGPSEDIPKDGFTGTDHNNVVAAKFPLGQKVRCYNSGSTGNVGWGTMIYLRAIGGTAPSVGSICSISDEGTAYTEVEANSAGFLNSAGTGLCAIAITAVTDDYYAWFWCGGNCPFDHLGSAVTTLTTTTAFVTDGNVAAGDEFTAYDDTSVGKFKRCVDTSTSLALGSCGFALAIDA